ncbi:MAG: hypothetical protein LH650_01600 [Chloroflexi bacterium]|nr:hypothetical protein [Chloroflexota bacterium]
MGRRSYPAKSPRRVLALHAAGRQVAALARDLEVSAHTHPPWRYQERIGQGLVPALTSFEREKLAAAKRRIGELAVQRRASDRGARGAQRPNSSFALTDIIRGVHLDSRGTYGARRVHVELTLGARTHRRTLCGGAAHGTGRPRRDVRSPGFVLALTRFRASPLLA